MADPEHMMNKLTLGTSKKKQYINILLLGESGVGKSTFINAFFNYLSCGSLEVAKQKFTTVIPTQFHIHDDDYKSTAVQDGADSNENMEVGASATQQAKSYVFPIHQKKKYIRLIDTPGIADVRGVDQDKLNFENILEFIGDMEFLNAICFLVKPNQDRLTVLFSFCIKQLLSKLDKSASRNLVFVFTNARQTSYRPGQTFELLKKMFEEFKEVNIPLSKDNTFCIDNEAFRYLVATKNGIEYKKKDKEMFLQSWQHSRDQCWRMVNYIAGDRVRNITALEPHLVKNTVSVNQARRLILRLSQPLAEIAQLIQDNILVLQRHKTQLCDHKMTLEELKNKLYMPVIDLRVTDLPHPVTVCTSLRCSTVHQIGERRKYEYRTKCHNRCYLTNVPKEIVGSPELTKCIAMGGTDTCKVCFCSYSRHQHIYYETEMFETQQVDCTVQDEIESKTMAEMAAKNIIDKIEQQLRELQSEQDIISNSTAKFAVFLQKNAIAPYNDAYDEYLVYLIDRERSLGQNADMRQIRNLEKMQSMYKIEKDQLLKAMNEKTTGVKHITADEVTKCVERLYGLKHNGQKIMDMFASQSSARKNENKSSIREYVHNDKAKNNKKGKNNENSNYGKSVAPKEDKQTGQCVADGNSKTQVLHITQGSLDIRFVNQGDQEDCAQVDLNKVKSQQDGRPQGQQTNYYSASGGSGQNQGYQNRRYSGQFQGAQSGSYSNSSACSDPAGGRPYQNQRGRYNQNYRPRNEPPPDYQETVRQDNQRFQPYQQGGPGRWGKQGGYYNNPNYNHYGNAAQYFNNPYPNFSHTPQYGYPGPNQPFGKFPNFDLNQQFVPFQHFVPNQNFPGFNPRHRGPYRGKQGPPSTFNNFNPRGDQQNYASGNFQKQGYESDGSWCGRNRYQRGNQSRGATPRRFVEYPLNQGKNAAKQPSKVTAFIQSSSDSSSDEESYFSSR